MSRSRKYRFTGAVLATVLLAGAPAWSSASDGSDSAPAPAEGEATQFVQSRAELVLSIVNASTVDSASLPEKRAELTAALREFLSYELLAERTLGDVWDTRTPEQRAEFTGVLRDLIEASYSRSLGKGTVETTEYEADFHGERTRRDLTTVEATITIGTTEHIVEVKMQRVGDAFLVFDLVTDDVSLEESYAESFSSIMAESGWDGLLERMRTRLTEIRAEL
jgi:ABC-type transporter MlaC component